jgi:hypothetical protein
MTNPLPPRIVLKTPTNAGAITLKTPIASFALPVFSGPAGPAGSAFEGTAWWYGEGEPGTIIGSKVGDYYMDTASGTIYRLGD